MKNYPLDDYGFEKFETNEFPLAYLITFRTFGTWLHGDKRFSVDRRKYNTYGASKIAPNEKLNKTMKTEMKQDAITLNKEQRNVVKIAIENLCKKRKYNLRAINVRSNHIHAVVSAQAEPERIADSFKAFATKRLREENIIPREVKMWARGRSRRYLWKPRHVNLAIDYVLYSQGDEEFEIPD